MIQNKFREMKYSCSGIILSPITIANNSIKAFKKVTVRPSEAWPMEMKVMHAMSIKPRLKKSTSTCARRRSSFLFRIIQNSIEITTQKPRIMDSKSNIRQLILKISPDAWIRTSIDHRHLS